jgi:hypothetical protein
MYSAAPNLVTPRVSDVVNVCIVYSPTVVTVPPVASGPGVMLAVPRPTLRHEFVSVVMSVQIYACPVVLFTQTWPTAEGLLVISGSVVATVVSDNSDNAEAPVAPTAPELPLTLAISSQALSVPSEKY